MPVLAVPLFNDELAPRFCTAGELVLVEVGEGGVLRRENLNVAGWTWSERLERLADKGVTVLLCCGFNARFLPHASSLGIEVVWGLAGEAEQIIAAYAAGDLEPYRILPRPGCRGRKLAWPYDFRARAPQRRGQDTERLKQMKVVIAAEDDRGLDGEVSAHFGRCPFYVCVEVNDGGVGEVEVVSNAHFGMHQPGIMPRFIQGLGADVIIAGGMGPRAIAMFQSMGIDVATGALGNVGKVLTAYIQGELSGTVPCAHDHEESCGGHGGGGGRGMGRG